MKTLFDLRFQLRERQKNGVPEISYLIMTAGDPEIVQGEWFPNIVAAATALSKDITEKIRESLHL